MNCAVCNDEFCLEDIETRHYLKFAFHVYIRIRYVRNICNTQKINKTHLLHKFGFTPISIAIPAESKKSWCG